MTVVRPATRLYVAAGLAAMLFYAALKAAWSLGSRVGVRDVGEWDRVFGALSPLENWLALWGTVVLAICGMVLLIVVGKPALLGPTPMRRPVRAFAWLVSVILGVFSLIALGATLVTIAREPVDAAAPSPLASWVYLLTYGSFLIYSLSLLWLCWSTRPGTTRTHASERIGHGPPDSPVIR